MIGSSQYILCSKCFKNAGISVEAEKIGCASAPECPRCGAPAGAKLTEENLLRLQDNFFIGGSRVSAYYPSPIGLGGAELSETQFEPNTWTDYLLIKEHTGRELFWYGPPLWRLGHSLLREKVEARLKPDDYDWPLSVGQETTLEELWDEAISILKPMVLERGKRLFRARMLAKKPLKTFEYDSPPADLVRPGRFNDSIHRVFYAAFDIDTCLLELKLGPSEIVRHEVTVAQFVLKQPLRVLNLCDIDNIGLEHADFVDRMALLDGLLFPHERDYFMTQSLSRHIEKRGFEGILHPSAFKYIANREARNLTVFGAPMNDGRIELLDVNAVTIESVTYDLRFGPAYEQ